MKATAGIVSRDWGFCRTLRDDGVSYCDYHDYILPKTMGCMAVNRFCRRPGRRSVHQKGSPKNGRRAGIGEPVIKRTETGYNVGKESGKRREWS